MLYMSNVFYFGGKIMKGYIRCLATVFGNYNQLQFDSKQILNMMEELKNYEVIPSVFDEFQIEVINNVPTTKTVKRSQFISSKEKLRISFTNNSIVIEADINVDENKNISITNIDKFITNVKKIYSIIYKMTGLKGNRISLISTYLDENCENNKYDKYVIPDNFYRGKDVFEWNLRSAVREKVKLANNNEIINVISNVSKTKGMFGSITPVPQNHQFDGTVFEVDINTIPQISENRIDDVFINEFYDYALSLKKKIEREGNYDGE